jgi:hypothetical protein
MTLLWCNQPSEAVIAYCDAGLSCALASFCIGPCPSWTNQMPSGPNTFLVPWIPCDPPFLLYDVAHGGYGGQLNRETKPPPDRLQQRVLHFPITPGVLCRLIRANVPSTRTGVCVTRHCEPHALGEHVSAQPSSTLLHRAGVDQTGKRPCINETDTCAHASSQAQMPRATSVQGEHRFTSSNIVIVISHSLEEPPASSKPNSLLLVIFLAQHLHTAV